MKQLAILGATGSIGASCLKVVDNNRDKLQIHTLTGAKNSELMLQLVIKYQPQLVIMADPDAASSLAKAVKAINSHCLVESGSKAIEQAAAASQIDIVVAAIVGAAGLASTLAAIRASKRVLLANKEALVMSGRLFMQELALSEAELLPIDSEHNAIYQAMPLAVQNSLGTCDLELAGVSSILLTGSGGPFRQLQLDALTKVTPQQACKHPNWSMGQKISVDSATMMNKGLEYIEAKYLFNANKGDIQVVIHPQSIIHSMVQYIDGSVIAQMGQPDMATPIAYALSYPKRIPAGVEPLDFIKLGSLDFQEPDFKRYPCLKLAIDACYHSQAATTVLNAVNEVAVAAFLAKQISYLAISHLVELVLNKITLPSQLSLDVILSLDLEARAVAQQNIGKLL